MKEYLFILFFISALIIAFVVAEKEDNNYSGALKKTLNTYINNNVHCVWNEKYQLCFCGNIVGKGGIPIVLTSAPNKVCGK